jgi:hypothetical protein
MLYTSDEKLAHVEQITSYLSKHEFITSKKASHLLQTTRAYATYLLLSNSKQFTKMYRSPNNIHGRKRVSWKTHA